MSRSLGELIRERRLERGYSLGQLAAKASTTAAVVRSWEKDEDSPEEEVLAILTDLLGFDAPGMAVAAKPVPIPGEHQGDGSAVEPPSTTKSAGVANPPEVTMPAEIAPPRRQVPAAADTVTAPAIDTTADSESALGDADLQELFAAVDRPAVLPAEVEEPASYPAVEPAPVAIEEVSPTSAHVTVPEAEPAPALVERPGAEPTAPGAPRPVPLRYPMSAPTGVAVEITETEPNVWNPLRYLYDPNKPWLYWIRAALTVIVLLVLMNILFGSIGELFDKIGEVIDSIGTDTDSGVTETTVP